MGRFEPALFTVNYAIHCQQISEIDLYWKETSPQEMKTYIAINIYMGIVQLPELVMYFGGDFVICQKIKNTKITFARFQKRNQYLHLNDADGKTTNGDSLSKVRPALDITTKFESFLQPGQDLSVDEAMVGYKGRIYFKQYMPQKPTKWGIKVWSIADSHSGYLLKCDIYLGKKQESQNDLLLGEQVVMHLTEPFTGKWHHVYFDNVFTSLRLMSLLLEKNMYAYETVRTNRQNWPVVSKKPKHLKLKQGESRVLQYEKISATVWHDKRDVHLLSTNSNPLGKIDIEKRAKKKQELLYRVQSRLENIIKAWVV